jgi:hypothetical protein
MPKSLKSYCLLLVFLGFFGSLTYSFYVNTIFNINQNDQSRNVNPKISWIWASLNLTNEYEIDGKTFNGGDIIPIKGKVFNKVSLEPKPNINVSIFANGKLYLDFSNRTNINGDFKISFVIPRTINNNTQIEIWANVTDVLPGEIEYMNHYVITVLNNKIPNQKIDFGNIYVIIGTSIRIVFLIIVVKRKHKIIDIP